LSTSRIRRHLRPDDKVDRDDLVWAALTISFDNMIGELTGGMRTWEGAGRQPATIPVGRRHIVDVRQAASEFHLGQTPDAATSSWEISPSRLMMSAGGPDLLGSLITGNEE
jgi:hypothetical protein